MSPGGAVNLGKGAHPGRVAPGVPERIHCHVSELGQRLHTSLCPVDLSLSQEPQPDLRQRHTDFDQEREKNFLQDDLGAVRGRSRYDGHPEALRAKEQRKVKQRCDDVRLEGEVL